MVVDLLDNSFTTENEHYLNKFGFVLVDKTQDNKAVSGYGSPVYTTCLRLETEKHIWDLIINSQQLQINKVQYKHLTGNIKLKNNFLGDFHLKTKSSFFSFFLSTNKISNFYLKKGNKEFETKIFKIKNSLIELRDKEIEIKKVGDNLSFNFFFNNYFKDEYYDRVYIILSEIINE